MSILYSSRADLLPPPSSSLFLPLPTSSSSSSPLPPYQVFNQYLLQPSHGDFQNAGCSLRVMDYMKWTNSKIFFKWVLHSGVWGNPLFPLSQVYATCLPPLFTPQIHAACPPPPSPLPPPRG